MERYKEFIVSRRRAVSVEEISERFLISKTTARGAANELLSEGRVQVVYARSPKGRMVRKFRGKHA
jgi:predicted ArsR family transcriptional regulator